MTATSGPGMSLMQENIGYAVGTETPCVIVDVQRGGPSTGIPAVPMQGDMVQVRRGSHGDYESIAFAPASAQEMFDLTVRAFNMAEQVRTPVFVMADAALGHMREPVEIPEPNTVPKIRRKLPDPKTDPQEIQGFLDEDVAPMPIFGHGFKAHVTGSCHDERGMRNVVDAQALDGFVRTLTRKVEKQREALIQVESEETEDAEVVLLGYGMVGRAAKAIAQEARQTGLRVGSLRPITVWPFADREIQTLCENAKRVMVMENNLGQMLPYVQAAVNADVISLPPQVLGTLHRPQEVLERIQEVIS
ncbi:MAG: pyruvate ferredoxin oxidoreductase, partial [Candidatus Latescibacteria bacterium]|nr:pyruvate ferredoxin oxidoreductase [Candidatus Latescibacterota bacterium]